MVPAGCAGTAAAAPTSAAAGDDAAAALGVEHGEQPQRVLALAVLAFNGIVRLPHGAHGLEAGPTIPAVIFINWHRATSIRGCIGVVNSNSLSANR